MSFLREHKYVIAIFLLGSLLRLIGLDVLPAGLNQDEASAGYDAYAILTHGMDRNGYPYPVHLIAWGSGQNALYSYLAIPFIALFDLSVFSFRLPAALFGSFSILIMYWMFLQFSSRTGALIAAFLVAVSPWHLMMSRWGLEANIFPTIILLAVACLCYCPRKYSVVYAFTVLMGLSLYAYGTAYLFVPLMMAGIGIYLLIYRPIPMVHTLSAYVIGGIVAIPIVLFILVNLYEWEPMVSSLGSIPRYTGTNRFTEVTVLSSGEKLSQLVSNLEHAGRILVSDFHDGSFYNSIEGYGYLYHCSLPFIVIGLGLVVTGWFRQRDSLPHFAILLWFMGAVAVCASLSVNFNRMNIIFYPLIIFAAIGIEAILQHARSKLPGLIVLALFAVNAGFFIHYYVGEYKDRIGESFFESFEDAIKTVDSVAPKAEQVYVTHNINMAYIAVLFHTRYDVREYIKTRQIPHMNTMFQSVSSFGQYTFGDPRAAANVGHSFVVNNHELHAFHPSRFIVRQFKYYSAVFSRRRYQEQGGEIILRD